jgi:hypothetical protein
MTPSRTPPFGIPVEVPAVRHIGIAMREQKSLSLAVKRFLGCL